MLLVYLCLFYFSANFLHFAFADIEDCSLDLNTDFEDTHPLILSAEENVFILPNGKSQSGDTGIYLDPGQKIRLACPGKSNYLYVTGNKNVNEVEAECIEGQVFKVMEVDEPIAFKLLKCVEFPEPTVQRTGRKCLKNRTEIEIGFQVSRGFIPIITTCFDEIKKDSLYSSYNLSSRIKIFQNVSRENWNFVEGDFYSGLKQKPTDLYKIKTQQKTLSGILNSNELADKYINENNSISRGHLTARRDFIYASQQKATFHYLNVAPQWNKFNGGNWETVEHLVRQIADQYEQNFTVYTGVYETVKFPDENNLNHEIFLYVDDKYQALTVPQIFWKILYEPFSGKALAFVGHNNPYEDSVKPLCEDKCGKLRNDFHYIDLGYTYCCEVDELRKVVTTIPDIPVQGIGYWLISSAFNYFASGPVILSICLLNIVISLSFANSC